MMPPEEGPPMDRRGSRPSRRKVVAGGGLGERGRDRAGGGVRLSASPAVGLTLPNEIMLQVTEVIS
jgi:hypothetical protein